ncbi:MAG: hypothetical protein E7379_02030 [Clostridiales bacterium]|nr:hypothetical protein [Clostridiales bacterium]
MKLKSVDQPKIFYQVAHRLIILQKEPFSTQSLLKEYYAKCGSNINLDYAKKVVLEVLNDLLNKGLVKNGKNKTNTYYTIFIEKTTNNQEKLKEELAKDESWIMLY